MDLSEFQEEWDVAQVPNVHADYAAAAFLQDPAAWEQQSMLPPQEENAWTAASLSLPLPPVTEFQAAPKTRLRPHPAFAASVPATAWGGLQACGL
jgi:hypothetical protein